MPEAALPATASTPGLMARLQARLAGENAREMLALYIVHGATIAAPLIVVPYASRVLGPEKWGIYSVFHSLALYASMVVEYGFNLSAAREVARVRDSQPDRARLLSEVFAAKLILTAVLLAGLWTAAWLVPLLGSQPWLMIGTALFAVGQGASMVWYFQGTSRIREIASIEAGGRVLAIALTFVFVTTGDDGWLLLVTNGAALVLVAALTGAMAVREAGIEPMRWRGAVRVLKDGVSLFAFRGAVSLYTLANSLVLGLLAPAASVGFFAGAERINKGLLGLLNPIIQAYYGRLSHAAVHDRAAFASMRRQCVFAITGTGLVLGIFVFATAPLLVRLLLGPRFEPAVEVLRILAILSPITAFNTTLGVHGLLPLGRDRAFNTVIVMAAALNLALAFALASRWQETGMGVAVVATETFVAAAFFLYLWREGLNPLAGPKDVP